MDPETGLLGPLGSQPTRAALHRSTIRHRTPSSITIGLVAPNETLCALKITVTAVTAGARRASEARSRAASDVLMHAERALLRMDHPVPIGSTPSSKSETRSGRKMPMGGNEAHASRGLNTRAGSETMASVSPATLRLSFQNAIARTRKDFEVVAIRKSDVYSISPWVRTRSRKTIIHTSSGRAGSI